MGIRTRRKLALKYHPDKNQGNEEANKKFAEINNGKRKKKISIYQFLIEEKILEEKNFFFGFFNQLMKFSVIARRGTFMIGMGRKD